MSAIEWTILLLECVIIVIVGGGWAYMVWDDLRPVKSAPPAPQEDKR